MPMRRYDRIVVLTGAGLSAESGLSTFRDPNGIWSKYDWREVATPEGFAANPDKVHAFYNARRCAHATVAPNAAHIALARLQRRFPASVIVTQNIDALHEAAGTQNLIHMHGELLKALCSSCRTRHTCAGDLATNSICPACQTTGSMRPDVVWFGEMPYEMPRIADAIAACDLFVSIGTSGNVYPAAGFVAAACEVGAHTVELNLEPSEGASQFAEHRYGPATKIVPAYIDRLIDAATDA